MCECDAETIIWKHPIEDFDSTMQLVVQKEQKAVFCAYGDLLDVFEEGKHSLESQNEPKIVEYFNLKSENKTAFHCDLFFVNTDKPIHIEWETIQPIYVSDENFHIRVPVIAHGDLILSIGDFQRLVMFVSTTNNNIDLHTFFRELLLQRLDIYFNEYIEQISKTNTYGLFNTLANPSDISERTKELLIPDFDVFGLIIDSFSFLDISLKEPSNPLVTKKISYFRRHNHVNYDEYYKIAKIFVREYSNHTESPSNNNINSMSSFNSDLVEFSAIASKNVTKGDYTIIQVIMFDESSRNMVESIIQSADEPVTETRSGKHNVRSGSTVRVLLSSPDIVIEDNEETEIWQGGFLNFSFAVNIPEQYEKQQILFIASVYVNDIIVTKLKFIAKCSSDTKQRLVVQRDNILSAFISYASEDRKRVASIIQGMKKIRPDLDIFFDVENLRSGEDWAQALHQEIEKRDVLYLFWSHYAQKSKWVDAEWRYAFELKGSDGIEPVPLESPHSCPPPQELKHKHFNDKLLFVINSVDDRNSD